MSVPIYGPAVNTARHVKPAEKPVTPSNGLKLRQVRRQPTHWQEWPFTGNNVVVSKKTGKSKVVKQCIIAERERQFPWFGRRV